MDSSTIYLLITLLGATLPVAGYAKDCTQQSDWYAGVSCLDSQITDRDQKISELYNSLFEGENNSAGFMHTLHHDWYDAVASVCLADTATKLTMTQLACLADRYQYHQYMWLNVIKMFQDFNRNNLISMQRYAEAGDKQIIQALHHEKLSPFAVSVINKTLPVFYVFHDDGEKSGIYFYDTRSEKIIKIFSRISELTAIQNSGENYQMLFAGKFRSFGMTDEQYFLSTLTRSAGGFIVTAKNVMNSRYYNKDDVCGKSTQDTPGTATVTVVKFYKFVTDTNEGKSHIDFTVDKTDCSTNLTTTVSVEKNI